MGEVIRFVPKSERERARLIREARANYSRVFPPSDPVCEQRDKASASQMLIGADVQSGGGTHHDRDHRRALQFVFSGKLPTEATSHRRIREGLQPPAARGHRFTDCRCLTRLRKRLPAQARPVITRANNSKLPTTATARDQSEPNQPYKCISNGQDRPAASGILSSIKRKQSSAACPEVSRSNLARD
jgi:hypothetical protein